jgi:mercuric ion transport protein
MVLFANHAPVMKQHRNSFIASLIGTVAVAVCCFTLLLVIIFGAIGLGTAIPYLDFILLPALAILIIVTTVSFMKWRKTS